MMLKNVITVKNIYILWNVCVVFDDSLNKHYLFET